MNSIYGTSYFFNATEYWLQKVQEKPVGLQPWSERDVNDLHTNGGRGETHTIKVSHSVGELSHRRDAHKLWVTCMARSAGGR